MRKSAYSAAMLQEYSRYELNLRINHSPRSSTHKPFNNEYAIIKTIYAMNFPAPRTIFNAPRFVIFVAGPVIMKALALAMLIPSASH